MPTPLLQYDMQETSGSTLIESISGNHGIYGHFDGVDNTVKGGDSIRASDPNAVSVQLGNPSKNILTLPDTLGLGGVVSLSVELLVRFDDISGTSNETLFNLYGAFFKFSFNQNDKSFRPSIATHTIVHSVPDIANGDIHHLVLVFDHNTPRLHLYIDGGLAASSISGAVIDFVDGKPSTNIATNVVGSGNWATTSNSKSYSHLRIYDTALTAQEVTELYDASISAPTTPTTFNDYVTSLNPVANYRLGDTSGIVATDETGNYNGTYNGNPTLGVTGLLTNDNDTAVEFDGINDHIITSLPLSNLGVDFAISVIVTVSNLSGVMFIIGDDNVTQAGKEIQLAISATGMFFVSRETSGYNAAISPPLVVGQTYHIVGMVKSGTNYLYVDGVEYIGGSGENPNTGNLLIGQRDDASIMYNFNGILDEVSIFDTALTEEQILTLYALARISSANYLSHNALISASNPTAHYRLGETSGTVATDETGNHHGTYVNSPTLGATGLIPHDNDNAVGISSGHEIHSNVGVPASGFSVSFLVKIDTHIPNGTPVALQASSIYKCLPMIRSSSDFYRSYIVTTTGTTNYQIPVTFNLDETYHIVSTAEEGLYKVWVNGTEVLSEVITGNLVATNNLLVNGWNNTKHVFEGTLDELSIFNTVLTEDEIKTLYVASKIDLTELLAEATIKKVTITIVESQAVDHWTAVALDYSTHEVVHWQELGDAGAHDVLIPETVSAPYVLLIIPYVGDVWDSQTEKSVGDLVFPTDTQTTPHFYKCKTAGTTSSAEPVWTINAGDIIDGSVLWEYVGIIPEGLAHYPVTTLPS